jgi:glutamate-5-semialdehyde dehydrogenase
MNAQANLTLEDYCLQVAEQARTAAKALASSSGALKNRWLIESATTLRKRVDDILAANEQDLAAAPNYGLTEAQIDRLRLDEIRIDGIASGLTDVAGLPDPIGEVIESTVRPNGLQLSKIRVPLGVVFFIYESRPNVTADAAAICVKSGNAVILRGGKEAMHSSRAIVDVLQEVGSSVGLPAGCVQLVNTTDREAIGNFLRLGDYIDLAIPRGGEGLIRRVAAEATMPVLKHFDGNCHVYVDRNVDLDMARRIVVNSKCQRMGVCNACESLVVHQDVADEFLPLIASDLAAHQVEIRGDEATCKVVFNASTATKEDYRKEYLAPTISVKVVASLAEAIDHINTYGSHHTDAIVTNDLSAARQFAREIDSAAVMINASTRFNDGSEFGLGAEIGISTDRFHARGPCGLRELTSYKWVAYGDGHVRE